MLYMLFFIKNRTMKDQLDQHIDLIHRFLEGEMSAEEEIKFNEEVKQNSVLAKDYQLYLAAENWIEEQKDKALEKRIRQVKERVLKEREDEIDTES